MHVLTGTYRFDTRNDDDNPWTGWLVAADVERGSGRLVGPGGFVDPADVRYTRVFADIRRYNRLSPDAQLNFRTVLGARLGSGSLPLQRRFSVGGPGSLPGFDFRRNPGGADVGRCVLGDDLPGLPALCERLMLAQVEYRGAMGFGSLRNAGTFGEWLRKYEARFPQWVAFADAGRGWLIGAEGNDLEYSTGFVIPPLGTFRTDIGLGLDARDIGLFVAKSLSHSKEPVNFFVRVRHRF
jgi:outer membrane protein assembly factor BamA